MPSVIKFINFVVIFGLSLLIAISPWYYGSVNLNHQAIIFIIIIALFILKTLELKLLNSNLQLPVRLLFPLFLLLALSFISIFFSIYPYQTFITFLKLIAWIFLLFLTINTVKNKKIFSYFIYIIIVTCIFYSIYGILQYQGLLGKTFWTQQNSLSSRYVNSSHFSGYLIMTVFIFLGLFIYLKRFWQKALIAFLSFPVFYAIIYTRSRFGWLSLSVALILFFIVSLKILKNRKKQIIFLLVFGFLFLAILSFLSHDILLTRLKEITHTKYQSLNQRLDIWHGTLKAFMHYPWGSGLGTFKYIYPQFRIHSDRFTANFAHNEYLQTLLELGISGIMLLIWSIFRFLKYAFKSIKTSKETALINTGLICAIISVLFYSLLDFPLRIPANTVLFVIILGMLVKNIKTANIIKLHNVNLHGKSKYFIITICIFLLFLYQRIYFSDAYFKIAEQQFKNAKWDEAIINYKKAVGFISYDSVYFERLGTIYFLKANLAFKNKDFLVDKTKDYFNKSLKSNFHNYNSHLNLAWLYANFFKDRDKSIYHFKKAIEFNLTAGGFHKSFARYLLRFGKIDCAIEEYRKSFELFPIEESVRQSVDEIFLSCYGYTKDYSKLKNIIPKNNVELHLSFGRFLLSKELWIEARNEFELSKKLNCNNLDLRLRIALNYEKNNKLDYALHEYEGIIKIDPDNEKAIEAIKRLNIKIHE